MDIKLKRVSHSIWVKTIVFVLIIMFFTNTIMLYLNLGVNLGGNFKIIFENDYFHSTEFRYESKAIYDNLYDLISVYRSEDYLRDKDNLTNDEIENTKSEYYGLNFREVDYDTYFNENPDLVDELTDQLVENKLNNFKSIKKSLDKKKGIKYYATNGAEVFSNSNLDKISQFRSFPAYLLYSGELREEHPVEYNYSDNYVYFDNIENVDDIRIFIGFTEEYLQENSKSWDKQKEKGEGYIQDIIKNMLALLSLFIFYLVLVGRKYFGDKEVSLNTFDRLYTDINIFFCLIIIFLWAALTISLMDNLYSYEHRQYNINLDYTIRAATIIGGSLGLLLVTSLTKHLKNKSFVRHSLIVNSLKFVGSIFTASSLGKRVGIFMFFYAITIFILTIILVSGQRFIVGFTSLLGLPSIVLLVIYYISKKSHDFENIRKGVKIIRQGDLNHKIEVNSNREFKELSDDINTISQGLENAIDNELKSERMRSELITNVSHDIRTPLTSIITYIDLLKNEKDEAKREEYLKVLSNKSYRLKALIDDLFEASKVSSGSIEVNLEKIDLVALIKQGLGELSDKIEENKLDFILDFQGLEEVYVLADGHLLWRALENLFSNIFKYSLEGSRVYVDIRINSGYVYLTMKNISAYELNISEKELMERFKRGDDSRTSEGSGLGLSIADSIIDIQGGKFEIDIDGDLFKTIVKLREYK